MKIALGMIVRTLDAEAKLMSFIENAEKYGHKLDCVIVAHTRQHDEKIEKQIREKATLYAVDINNPEYCRSQMQRLNIPEAAMKTLLDCPVDTTSGLIPYGHNRMIVVMEAILREIEVLFFVDSDIVPLLLKNTQNGHVLEETDFFKAHLDELKKGTDVTSGEYSGYNILPPASFDGMADFLAGVQKAEMLEYWQTSDKHKCITYQPDEIIVKPCKKILGGNLAIRLSAFSNLPPFFSSHYMLDGELYLCRGEDTVLGYEIASLGTKCTDIGIYPLHDTYDSFPEVPDLVNDELVQRRLFFACTGWVGRNPFYNYILGKDPKETRQFQREHLEKGLKALSDYTKNPQYLGVLKNFDVSWDNLDRYINEFETVTDAWNKFKKGVGLK
ncbi:MAG: hypothetical protein FWD44_09155 [Oscillospiraceae bacterium]|nr:hypothetical protein [Oscillospiraceae bacterium]